MLKKERIADQCDEHQCSFACIKLASGKKKRCPERSESWSVSLQYYSYQLSSIPCMDVPSCRLDCAIRLSRTDAAGREGPPTGEKKMLSPSNSLLHLDWQLWWWALTLHLTSTTWAHSHRQQHIASSYSCSLLFFLSLSSSKHSTSIEKR